MALDSRGWRTIAGGALLLTLSGCASVAQRPNPSIDKKAQANEEKAPANEEKAQELLDEASALLDAEKYAEACPKLEKAVELVPDAIGARMALGECYEGEQRLSSAYKHYLRAQMLAQGIKDIKRATAAWAGRDRFVARIPVVVVAAPEELADLAKLTILVDGIETYQKNDKHGLPHKIVFWVDHGPHILEIRVNEYHAWSRRFIIENGQTINVVVPPLPLPNYE